MTIEIITQELSAWYDNLLAELPSIAVAILVFIAFLIIAGFSKKYAKKTLKRFSSNRSLVSFLAFVIAGSIALIGFMISLSILNLQDAAFSLLASVGVLGIILGFAFQDIAANFIAGVALSLRKNEPFKEGDIVDTNDVQGTVRTINIRDSKVETFDGKIVYIPNKLIFENIVINYSQKGTRRVDLSVGVSYGDDLSKVEKVLRDTLDKPEIFFSEFGDSSINAQVRFWVDFEKQTDFLSARSDAIKKIKDAFDKNDITIPFPIRTLDFGIKGGVRYDEVR